mmetsp:Transcript_2232/g.5855  ORF Transcript_2232/g.5855 Transcript_2232/m.5855 type:complete len:198 (+) Transcript_2232:83-676(+)
MAAPVALVCTRCRRAGHAAKDCQVLSFTRRTPAELRAERLAKRAEWEERQAERQARRAEWEEKQERWHSRQAQREKEQERWELCSQATDASTAATTAAMTPEDEEEVERRVAADRAVRRHEKALREIAKLEARGDLDALQRAKLQRRPEVEAELSTARGLAGALARNELRRAARARVQWGRQPPARGGRREGAMCSA